MEEAIITLLAEGMGGGGVEALPMIATKAFSSFQFLSHNSIRT